MGNAYPRRPALVRSSVSNIESSPGELHAQQHVIPLDKPRLYTFIPSGTDTPDSVTVLDVSGGADGVWRDVPYDDRGTNLTDANETLQVSGEQWRRLVAGTLTADRTKTLGTTQARAGHTLLITSTESTAYALTIANGGAGAGTLATLRGPGWLLAFFDGTNWVARSFGGAATIGANPGAQAAWYVNPSTGSDAATGSSTAPLKTCSEFLRRVRGLTITTAVSVTIQGNSTSENLFMDLALDTNASVTFYGSRTTVLSGTLTTGTRNWDSTVPQDGRVIDSALATSWTASLGSNLNGLMTITTAGGAATAWIMEDLGSKTARISPPMLASFSAATIASGNAYTVSTLTKLGAEVTVCVRGGHNSYVAFVDLELGTTGGLHSVEVFGGNITTATCAVNGLDHFGNFALTDVGSKFNNGPRVQHGGTINLMYSLPISTSSSAQVRGGSKMTLTNVACQGMQFLVDVDGTALVQSGSFLAVYSPNVSASGNGIDVLSGGLLRCAGRVFGTTTATGSNSGIFVDACGSVVYNTSAANLLPAISGATNDTKIGGTVKTYAQLPYVDTTNGSAFGGSTFPRG